MVAKLIHARSPRRQPPVRRGRVRGAAGEPAPERAVRPRARGVHRRRPRQARACSRWRTAARSSSTRSARSARPPRSSCCACSTRRPSATSGGTTEIQVDVRVLAATNRDLPAMVRQGLFREDLFYRLSTITLRAAAAAASGAADVDLLAEHFVARAQRALRLRASASAPRALERAAAARLARQRARAAARDRGGDGRLRRRRRSCPSTCPRALAAPAPAAGARRGRRRLRCRRSSRWSARTSSARCGRPTATAATPRSMLGISERNLYRKLREYGLLP